MYNKSKKLILKFIQRIGKLLYLFAGE